LGFILVAICVVHLLGGSIWEENQTELDGAVFKIHSNRTELNSVSFEPNRTVKMI
jgi:hypothetical protein